MKNKIITLFGIFVIIISTNVSAQDIGRPITLIGFGMTVDVPGSYGDAWASTWSLDDSVIFMNNDGYGIIRSRTPWSTERNYQAHTVINSVPPSFMPENPVSLADQRDGRKVIHPVDRNYFTARHWGNFKNQQPWYPYSTDIYEVDGALYCNFVYSFQIPGNWGYFYSNLMRSTDGGKTWQNHKGQIDTPLEQNWEDAFCPRGWEHVRFVKYGRGGVAPDVDRAQEYVYIHSSVEEKYNPPGGSGVYMARIKRNDLKEWKTTPDGNGDNVRKKLEFLSYGRINSLSDAQAVLNDRHWTSDYSRAKSIGYFPYTYIVYNELLRRYLGTSFFSDSWFQNQAKMESTILLYEAPHPWGPWNELLDEHMTAKGNDNLCLAFLTQKYISDDGYKIWMAVNGAQATNSHSNREGYFLKFLPIYLTTEQVFTVKATDTSTVTVNGLTRQTHREHEYASWRYEGGVSTGYGGFTIDGNNLTFNIDVPSAGDYIVNFRYRTKGVPRWTTMAAYRRDPFPSISLYVNNTKAKQLRLGRSIQLYSNWTEMSIFLRLNTGSNTITFQRDRGDVSDSIVISRLKYALYTGSSPLSLDNIEP
jgi:hypothetical protein